MSVMNISRETASGWLVSLAVHGMLLLIFLFVSIKEVVQNQNFIEVIWSSPSGSFTAPETRSELSPLSPSPSPKKASTNSVSLKKSSQAVILPERRMTDISHEVPQSPRSERLETPETGGGKEKTRVGGIGERESVKGTSIGNRESGTALTGGPSSSVGPLSNGGGGVGEVDQGIAFSIQWTQGGTRRKIAGDLPKYPSGVNVEAQIKILAVVQPDGSIKTVQPAQKGNTRLEDVAMKEVQFWKFEPLRQAQPQKDQSCVIIFLFTLK